MVARRGTPSSAVSHDLAMNAAFFAPDGQHDWIIGFDHDTNHALGLASTDGGATRTSITGFG